MRKNMLLSAVILLLAAPRTIPAQQGILGRNLIVNGDAEAGPAGTGIAAVVASIPGWTRAGNITVLPYNLTGYVLPGNPAPPDHGFQYFGGATGAGPSNPATITQDIDVSSAAAIITGGNVKYTASAYLGTAKGGGLKAQMAVAFKNASGQTFTSATLGPLAFPGTGLSLQQQIGLVPPGTIRITVTLSLSSAAGSLAVADSLSLVLNPLVTSPPSVLGPNLVVNGGAEEGPSSPLPGTTLYVPGWSTKAIAVSVEPYGATTSIAASDPGPPDRGVKLFCGSPLQANSDAYQDLDVSAAADLIDRGKVTYNISAWLGSVAGLPSPTLTYIFFDWSGMQLAPASQLVPPSHAGNALVGTSHSGILPSGTRRVNMLVSFPSERSVADNISFTLAAPSAPPMIGTAGVVSASAFGGFSDIGRGTWIEIYGANLASTTRGWSGSDFNNGVAPTSLDGVSVSVGGAPAFVDYVSPGQINALVASDAPTGMVQLTVTNSNGTSDGFGLRVNQTQPGLLAPSAFLIGGKQYAAALFPDGQTFAIPQGAISGVASHPAKVGDTVTIYGVGFGPVTGGFTAGTIVTQQNSLTTPLQFFFGTAPANLTYYGLVPSFTGLYQFNVVVPNVTANDALPISINFGGVKGSQSLYIAVQN